MLFEMFHSINLSQVIRANLVDSVSDTIRVIRRYLDTLGPQFHLDKCIIF